MSQSLMAQALDSKERAHFCLSFFQNEDNEELRKRGYRPLPSEYQGCYKTVYLSHDHVVKVGRNAEREWRLYLRHTSETKKYLVPTVRLGRNVILQPKGRPIAKSVSGEWTWKVCKYKWGKTVRTVRKQLELHVRDSHFGNFALFGDTILCIDFAEWDD